MAVIDEFGSDPAIIKWNITRGDTSKLKVEFLNSDEVTRFNTTGWEYTATAYDPKTDIADELETKFVNGALEVVAPSDITENWGTAYNATVAELLFDIQVTGDDFIWTPIVGTISVIGDISGAI